MTKPVHYTARAITELEEIVDWTFETFGPKQAIRYGSILEARIVDLAAGHVPFRTGDSLSGRPHDAALQFITAGQHVIFFVDTPNAITILSIRHSRSNLLRHLSSLIPNPKDV